MKNIRERTNKKERKGKTELNRTNGKKERISKKETNKKNQ